MEAFSTCLPSNATEKKRGVAACSAGNHGLGVAYAGKELQVPCTVFVPKSVDQAKYDKLVALGAHVKKSEFVGYDDTLAWAEQEAKKLQIPLISAFDDEKIMAANGGTFAVEVMAQRCRMRRTLSCPWAVEDYRQGFPGMPKMHNPRSTNAHLPACRVSSSQAFS